MIIKPDYPQEVILDNTCGSYNTNTRINVEVIYSEDSIEIFIKNIDSYRVSLDKMNLIYEFVDTYEEHNLFHEGKNYFDLVEHGGWGNNEWVTWYRPIEHLDERFCK